MDNVALITGASSGIGKELARIHAEHKGDLVIVARTEEKLIELKTELESKHGISVKVISKDLTQSSAVKEIYDDLKKEGIEIEYLLNNAGFGGLGKFHERDLADDLAMINLNIVALTALTRMFLPDFVKRNSGRVLNVSSTAALMPGPLQAVYFATKAYVTSFSNAIAEELSDTNVTVTVLMPGATATDFATTAGLDDTDMFKNTFTARSVAEAGYDGMKKGKLDVIAGVTTMQKLMLTMIPVSPKKMILKQVKQMQSSKS